MNILDSEEFETKTQKIKSKYAKEWAEISENELSFHTLDALRYETLYDMAEVGLYVKYKEELYLLVEVMWETDFQYKDARKRTIAWLVRRDFQKRNRTPIGRKPLERVAEYKDDGVSKDRENPMDSYTNVDVYKDMTSYVEQVAVKHIPLLETIVDQIEGSIIAPADANGIIAGIVERRKQDGRRPQTDIVISGDKFYSGPLTEREIIGETLLRGGGNLPVILSYAYCFTTEEERATLILRPGPVIFVDAWPILISRGDLLSQGPNMTAYKKKLIQTVTSIDSKRLREDPPFTTNFLLQGPRYQFLDWGESAQFHVDYYPEHQYGSPHKYILDYLKLRGLVTYRDGSYVAHTVAAWLSKPKDSPAYLVGMGASQITPIIYVGQEVFAGRIYEDVNQLWPESFECMGRRFFYYAITSQKKFKSDTRVFYVYPEDCPYKIEYGQIRDVTFGQVLAIEQKEDHIRFLNNFAWKGRHADVWVHYLRKNGSLATEYATRQIALLRGFKEEVYDPEHFLVTPISTTTRERLEGELNDRRIKFFVHNDGSLIATMKRPVKLNHGVLERVQFLADDE